MIRRKLTQFAAEYDRSEERLTGGDDQSSIHYPAVFLFIGDKSREAIQPIMRMNEKKWENSEGLIYLYAGSAGEPADARLLKYHFPVAAQEEANPQTLRPGLYRRFYADAQGLPELNRVLRQASGALAEYGRLYPAFDRVRLSIVTRVDDPFNVLVPEISLLAEAIFRQSFKAVQMDLYALINEREGAEAFGYSSSLGVAFLRELNLMQQPDFALTAPLHVTEDGLAIPVSHPPSPLFDLVYILSDRDERGIASNQGMQGCYEAISHISLLKNRQYKEQMFHANNAVYNNTSFKNNIMTESGRQGFVSAGLSKVKRPNQSIALAVLYHFYRGLLTRMKQEPALSAAEKLAFFGVDTAALDRASLQLTPSQERLNEMHGLMSNDISYAAIRKLPLKEAEEALFGGGGEAFFRSNFQEEAARRLQEFRAVNGWTRRSGSRFRSIPMWRSIPWRPGPRMRRMAALRALWTSLGTAAGTRRCCWHRPKPSWSNSVRAGWRSRAFRACR